MKIIKNFLFLICITLIFKNIAMEELTLQERKALRPSLEALSLEMPKYQPNNARQNFNTLMGIFCSTKGDTHYNFLETLRIEQEDLEIRNLKIQEELFNLNYASKNNFLKQEQESLKKSENNLNQVIEQVKEEFKKLEILKKESNIEILKIDHQNELNALKDDYQKKLKAHHETSEERYKKDCAAFQNKVIEDNQKSLITITDRQKAVLEDFRTQLETDYQNKKTTLEKEYATKKINLESEYLNKTIDLDVQKNKNIDDANNLRTKLAIELSQHKTAFESQYKKANQLSLLQRYPITTLVSGLLFGSFLTGLSIHYNIANNSLDSITTLVEKLFNKTH